MKPSAQKRFTLRKSRHRDIPMTASVFDSIENAVAPLLKSLRRERIPRHVVLDTWCICDFILRRLFVVFLDIDKFRSKDYSPEFELLPRSFTELLSAIRKFRAQQLRLEVDAYLEGSVLKGTGKFWDHMDQILGKDALTAAYDSYYRKHQPEMIEYLKKRPAFGKVSSGVTPAQRAFLEALDDPWFAAAERLNRARNIAAHSPSDSAVLQVFGVSGPRATILLRSECFYLLEVLFARK